MANNILSEIQQSIDVSLPLAISLKSAFATLPRIPITVWQDPYASAAWLRFEPEAPASVREPWKETVASACEEWHETHELPPAHDYLVKLAYSPTVRWMLEQANLVPGKLLGAVPNFPSPLSSTVTGGLLGLGLGYGTGWLAEQLLPQEWRRNRLRRTMAGLGAAVGASPGLLWSYVNTREGKPLWSSWPHDPQATRPTDAALDVPFREIQKNMEQPKAAQASDASFPTGAGGVAPIPVDAFNRVIWGDPRVATRLDSPTQAAASSIVTTASRFGQPGFQSSPFVTPGQIGALAVGMGSGYISGALVGKALGALMGMPESTQERLKTTGMWAGVIKNLIPMLF